MPHVLAIRCDGDERIGAGHVARCLPLARAFADRGWRVRFAGSYSGLAARLLDGVETGPLEGADAAVVDSYERQAIPDGLPLATIGEALTYPGAIVVDYHLDRLAEGDGPQLLVGPRYAPIDPRFARAGRAATDARAALVTVGAGAAARERIPGLVADLKAAFGEIEVRVATGADPLLDLVREVDVAVTGAGLTAYELASAGLPLALVQLAANQRRVVDGCLREGVAVSTVAELPAAPRPNRRVMELFDGLGAARAAAALEERWALA